MVALLQPGVRDDQPAAVEHQVRDQPRAEREHASGTPRPRRRASSRVRARFRDWPGAPAPAPPPRGTSLCSWLPGDRQRVAPAATMPMASRSTAGGSGPRSTRSPRKTTRRPAGCTAPTARPSLVSLQLVAEACQQLLQLVGAAVHVADDVERSALGTPVDRRGHRSVTAGRGDGRRRAQDVDLRSPSRLTEPRQADEDVSCWRRTACGAERRSGPVRAPWRPQGPRAGPARSRRAGRRARRPAPANGLRAAGSTLVASRTVSRPAASRASDDRRATSKAAPVAAWSRASSATIARQASDWRRPASARNAAPRRSDFPCRRRRPGRPGKAPARAATRAPPYCSLPQCRPIRRHARARAAGAAIPRRRWRPPWLRSTRRPPPQPAADYTSACTSAHRCPSLPATRFDRQTVSGDGTDRPRAHPINLTDSPLIMLTAIVNTTARPASTREDQSITLIARRQPRSAEYGSRAGPPRVRVTSCVIARRRER